MKVFTILTFQFRLTFQSKTSTIKNSDQNRKIRLYRILNVIVTWQRMCKCFYKCSWMFYKRVRKFRSRKVLLPISKLFKDTSFVGAVFAHKYVFRERRAPSSSDAPKSQIINRGMTFRRFKGISKVTRTNGEDSKVCEGAPRTDRAEESGNLVQRHVLSRVRERLLRSLSSRYLARIETLHGCFSIFDLPHGAFSPVNMHPHT